MSRRKTEQASTESLDLVDSPTTVILPIRDFTGMSRLVDVLPQQGRTDLSRTLASRAAAAVRGAGFDLLVVSSSEPVISWARMNDAETLPDPGRGLSCAAKAGVEHVGSGTWIVLHADLPLVTAGSLRRISDHVTTSDRANGATVLVPSQDGGTNVIASRGPFTFSYGPGSFHRHLANAPYATIVSSAELSIDIDSEAQLASFPELVSLS